MKSSWDHTKSHSTYHFDSTRLDREQDVLIYHGRLPVTWSTDLAQIINNSKPVTWETRGYKGQGRDQPPQDLAAEEYDLERSGADPKLTISSMNWQIPPSLQAISQHMGLEDCMDRIHVQWPGQLWNRHIDKLSKWCPDAPNRVFRVFVQLTDWQPGQFWEFGNYHWNHWQAGDVISFDWPNMPHATANAGHDPRVTFQMTGIITGQTLDFLADLPR